MPDVSKPPRRRPSRQVPEKRSTTRNDSDAVSRSSSASESRPDRPTAFPYSQKSTPQKLQNRDPEPVPRRTARDSAQSHGRESIHGRHTTGHSIDREPRLGLEIRTRDQPFGSFPPLRSPPAAVLAQAAAEVLAAQAAAAAAQERAALVAAVQAAARQRVDQEAAQVMLNMTARQAARAHTSAALDYPVQATQEGQSARHMAVTAAESAARHDSRMKLAARDDARMSLAISSRPGIFEVC